MTPESGKVEAARAYDPEQHAEDLLNECEGVLSASVRLRDALAYAYMRGKSVAILAECNPSAAQPAATSTAWSDPTDPASECAALFERIFGYWQSGEEWATNVPGPVEFRTALTRALAAAEQRGCAAGQEHLLRTIDKGAGSGAHRAPWGALAQLKPTPYAAILREKGAK